MGNFSDIKIDFKVINHYFESCERTAKFGTKEQKEKTESFFKNYVFSNKRYSEDEIDNFSREELEKISGPYLKHVVKNAEVYQFPDLIEKIAEVNKITAEKAMAVILLLLQEK